MKTYCILGNCQANAIASTLQAYAEFKQTFALQRIKPIHRISAEANGSKKEQNISLAMMLSTAENDLASLHRKYKECK